ncbi:MAG: hypothetical protein EBU36_00400 [Verrucomicrobia bacterium]|nr:hypothetical protein [Verrucomicrobiota bacterium]
MVDCMKKALGIFLVVAWSMGTGRSQSVSWNNPGPLVPNEAGQLELVFTDCQPSGSINVPQVNGLQILGQPGRATSFSMINFQTSSSTTLSYAVLLTQAGRIQIPSFEVPTDKGKKTVPGLALDATTTTAPSRRPSPSPQQNFPFPPGFFQNSPPPVASQGSPAGAVQATATADPSRPYAGEVFDVNYRVFITGNRSGRVKTTPLWDVQNFSAEAWDRGQQIGPGGSQGLQFHTRAMVPKPGTFDLPPIRQKLDLDTAMGGRSFFFTAPGSEEVEVSTDAVPLQIQPLPGGAPAGFKGAVGQFVLESKMVPEQVNEGEPVTWTLTLKGTGNWPMNIELPARTIPNQIRTIQPKLRKEFNGTDIFTGAVVEDLVMIPTQSGEYELPSVKFIYFDPKKKSYETAEAKPPKITVTKGAGGLSLANSQPTSTVNLSSGNKAKEPLPTMTTGRPAKPLQYGAPGLPQEPILGQSSLTFAPVSSSLLKGLCAIPWIGLLFGWWIWARRRAFLTDQERERKEALIVWKEAAQKIRDFVSRGDSPDNSLLEWQKAVAGTLGVEGATPSVTEIIRGAASFTDTDREEVRNCWQETEEALYGKGNSLSANWAERAISLAERIDLPPVRWWEGFRVRNLLPWFGASVLLFIVANDGLGAPSQELEKREDNPVSLYQAGKFEEAAKFWIKRVSTRAGDVAAQNNLALCYFQSGEKERALAHGLAAYLRSPRKESVAWNLKIYAASSDQLDPAVSRLMEEGFASWLTSRSGVFVWQGGVVFGFVTMATGCALLLASGYQSEKRKVWVRIGSIVLLLGALESGVAGTALGVYGKLSDADAVMIVDVEPLRTVPTEVEPQAEKAYPPGSIAHLEKTFLGWSKIRMPNHDVGWIRTEHLVPLY